MMLKRLWKILFGKPDQPIEELSKLSRFFLELRYLVYLFLITFLFIQPLVIASYDTPTGSMEPTIMTNTRYLALPSVYGGFCPFIPLKFPGFKKIQRGDIIIFKFPLNESENYVKRVIGLPGDRVEIKDTTVYINGNPLVEPYARYENTQNNLRNGYGPITVPPNHIFAMGDNRDDSYDSRYWGCVPVKNIFGTPLITFWSYDSKRHHIRFNEIFKLIK